ncbi:MAG TPA: hypothetical protein VMC41_02680 [Candidatus Nanoarchaeia archaeon]|nr:hypothetical protein [Candidatus Nanoarchaeia archaeon]
MDEDLKKILEQNSADMAEMKQMVKGIKNHFIRAEIYQWAVVALIVVPSVIALFLLWPMINSLPNIMSNGVGAITGSDVNQLK